MTKKDYELIAKVLRDENMYLVGKMGGGKARECREYIAEMFAGTLKSQDKRFKRVQFLHDCGIHDFTVTVTMPDGTTGRMCSVTGCDDIEQIK